MGFKTTKKRNVVLSLVTSKVGENIQREISQIRGDVKKIKKDFNPFKESEKMEKLLTKTKIKLFFNVSKDMEFVIGRSFDNEIIDMLKFKINDFKLSKDYGTMGAELHMKYYILCMNIKNERMENLFVDFFNMKSSKACLQNINYAWIISLKDDKYVLKYCRVLKDSSVEDIGPSFDMTLIESYHCGEEKYKKALGHQVNKSKAKNVEKNVFKDKIGKLHINKQDLKEIKTRKSKGFKK